MFVFSALLSGDAVSNRNGRGERRTEARSESRDQGRSTSKAKSQAKIYCATCERDAAGRIKRNSDARRAFQAVNPCPSVTATARTCPGYVIDHIVPLKRGGEDTPQNMQWQTTAEAKAKDRKE